MSRRLLLTLVAVVALTGCGGGQGTGVKEEPPPLADVAPAQAQVAPVEPTCPATTPRRLRLDAIDAPVVPLHLTGTELVPPPDPRVLGWWGRKAGAAHGRTLLVGHTVHDGGGALDDLEHVRPGQVAVLSGVRYRVRHVMVISKEALARRAPALFNQSGPHRLVIVTCEGYDPATGHYSSNVVLTATTR